MINERAKQMVLGGGLQQTLNFAAMPLVGFFFGASILGQFAEQLALGMLFAGLFSLRIEVTIPILSDRLSVETVIRSAYELNFIFALLVLTTIAVLEQTQFYGSVLIGVFANLNLVHHYVETRNNNFLKIAISKVAAPAVFILLILLVGYTSEVENESLVAICYAAGLFSSLLILKPSMPAVFSAGHHGLIKELIKQKNNSIFTSTSTVIDLLKDFLLLRLLALQFSHVESGLYFLASKIFITPLTLIASSISMVLYRDAAEATKEYRTIRPLLWPVLPMYTVYAVVAGFIIYWTLKIFVMHIGGSEWIGILDIAVPTAVIALSIFVMTVLSILVFVFSKQRSNLIFTILYFFSSLSPIFIATPLGFDFSDVIYMQAAFILIYSFFYLGWLIKVFSNYERSL